MLTRLLLAGVALCAASLPNAASAAVTESTFQLNTTSDLVDLCSAAPADPMGTAALNFCQGFALGVYRVLEEENAAKRIGKMFCIPETATQTRNEAIADFVQWAKTSPAVLAQRPANGIVAYLQTKFPCPRGK
ncbi:MAG: Rap1a/Tai family immunity protein [Acetobacteraceae bacterium]